MSEFPLLNPLSLVDKRILITGASSGIGRATAWLCSRLGAQLTIIGRNEENLKQTFTSLAGEGHTICPFDLVKTDDIPQLIKSLIHDVAKPFSGLFHSAGLSNVMPVKMMRLQHLDRTFAASVYGGMLLVRGLCQEDAYDKQGTSIVLMSSVAGQQGMGGLAIYSASKAAIDGMVRSLACELAPRHIRVNSLAAGAVETEMHEKLISNLSEDSVAEYERKHLLGFGKAEDVANAAAFLLSDASKWITGSVMNVDGGYCSH